MNTQTTLHKINLVWPVRWDSRRHQVGSLVKRYEAAVRHLIRTPKGSLYADHNYGTTFYKLRTQGMNKDAGSIEIQEFISAAARYIPDIDIPQGGTTVDKDHDNQKLTVRCLWIVSGAVPEVHGELGMPQKSVVQI